MKEQNLAMYGEILNVKGVAIMIQDQERINKTRRELRQLKALSMKRFKKLGSGAMDDVLTYLLSIDITDSLRSDSESLIKIDYCCDKIKEILKLPKTPIDLAWARALTGQFNYKYCINMVWSDLMRFNK